ncbi:MAG: DUF488 family protein [Pirellulales bacterium]|nr:DUF488 family protein [Pirellulales bacterium]
MQIQIKRVYDAPAATDGLRILVDRLWPRGLTKKQAAIDVWAKELAPSAELRKWFGHDDERFDEFTQRYGLELDRVTTEVTRLLATIGDGPATLLYSARNDDCNNAIVLMARIQRDQKRARENSRR